MRDSSEFFASAASPALTSGDTPRGRPFAKGNPGGPGRPPGARNKTTVMLDQLAAGEVDAVFAQVAKAARDGNLKAAEMILARAWPRNRPLGFEAPALAGADDLPAALAAIAAALARGELSAKEAVAAMALVNNHSDALLRFKTLPPL